MKLKKYEIDAVVNEILNKIKNNIKVPDFTKVIKEKEKAFLEVIKYKEMINIYQDKINKINKDYNINIYVSYQTKASDFNAEQHLKNEIANFITKSLPPTSDIENAVILSNNKDLNALVEELVKRYSK